VHHKGLGAAPCRCKATIHWPRTQPAVNSRPVRPSLSIDAATAIAVDATLTIPTIHTVDALLTEAKIAFVAAGAGAEITSAVAVQTGSHRTSAATKTGGALTPIERVPRPFVSATMPQAVANSGEAGIAEVRERETAAALLRPIMIRARKRPLAAYRAQW